MSWWYHPPRRLAGQAVGDAEAVPPGAGKYHPPPWPEGLSERFLPCARCRALGTLVRWTGRDGGPCSDAPGEPLESHPYECPECGPKIDPRCAPGCRREVREEPLEGIEKAADTLMKDPKWVFGGDIVPTKP